MTKYQKDEFTIRDGRITLYRRADSPSKIFQCRFMVNGKCIRRTNNESNELAPISTGQPGIALEAWGYP